MTDTRNHRRHGNALRAGGREFGREMLDDLIALTTPEAHANLRAIYAARAALPKWAKQAPTAADMIEKLSGAVALFRAVASANSDVVLRLQGTNETIKMGDFLA